MTSRRTASRPTAARRRSTPPQTKLDVLYLPVLLALGAEAGHLAAAVMEWPVSTPRGVFHILAAATHGMVVAGISVSPTRLQLRLGTVVTLAVPLMWLTGALLDITPYRDFPLPAAIAVSMLEVTTAGLLVRRG